MSNSPNIVQQNYFGFNIVLYRQAYYGIRQSVGPFNLESANQEVLNHLKVQNHLCEASSLREVQRKVRQCTPVIEVCSYYLRKGPGALMQRVRRAKRLFMQQMRQRSYFMPILQKPQISILMPSLGRAQRCLKMIQSTLGMAEQSKIEFLIFLDQDDPDPYEKVLANYVKWGIVRLFRQEATPISGVRYNFLAQHARGSILMYAADDIVFHTVGWDQMITDAYVAYPDSILLCSDKGSDVPLHGFISKKSVELLGFVFPPYFIYGYNDIWLGEVYKSLGRHLILKGLTIEHQHWHSHPELFDPTYAKVLSPTGEKVAEAKDTTIYEEKRGELLEDRKKLLSHIRETRTQRGGILNRQIQYPEGQLSDHYQITSTHPLFRDLFTHLPSSWAITPSTIPVNRAGSTYLRNFRRLAEFNGAAYEEIEAWIKSRCMIDARNEVPLNSAPLLLPTYPQYLGPLPWFLEIEDWTTLFDPFILNGKSEGVDIKNSPVYPIAKAMFEMPNFRGFVTHMKSTLRAVNNLFPGVSAHYVAPAFGEPLREPSEVSGIPVFSFVNSYQAGHRNFVLRGGREILSAFAELDRKGVPFQLFIRAKLDPMQLTEAQRTLLTSPKVIWAQEALTAGEIESWIHKSYAFLLPSYRLHAISTLQSLGLGTPLICSDGWGFEEIIEHRKNGLVVTGFRKKAYEDGSGILRENYDAGPNESLEVAEGIAAAVQELIANPALRKELSEGALRIVQERFSQEKRREELGKILDGLLN